MDAVAAHVLIVGRLSTEAKGVRGEAFAAGQGYFRAVERAGGVPFMLPPIPDVLDRLPSLLPRFDAVVMHGGGDVDPRHYGEEPAADELYGIVPEHDEVELAVVRAALDADLPMLAICRGMQIVNVALGGTLVQHIGTDDHWFALHPVQLDTGSRLSKAIGAERPAACHSVHHQSIGRARQRASPSSGRATTACPRRWRSTAPAGACACSGTPRTPPPPTPEQQSLFDELVRQAQPG